MAATRYVALLRGINVGGKNKVAMADLRKEFEHLGCRNVSTYIQSGNVLFESDAARAELERDVEKVLERHLESAPVVVVRTHRQMQGVVAKAPDGFGAQPTTFHSDCIFLKDPLTPAKAMRVVSLRDGVDEAWTGTGVLYFARLSAERTKSRMGKIVGTEEYRSMTIRSWQTTTKLLALLDALRDG